MANNLKDQIYNAEPEHVKKLARLGLQSTSSLELRLSKSEVAGLDKKHWSKFRKCRLLRGLRGKATFLPEYLKQQRCSGKVFCK